MRPHASDSRLIRRFGSYRYRRAPEGNELVLDADASSLVNTVVGAALLTGSIAGAWTSTVPWPPALVGVMMGGLIFITALGAATDHSRTLFTGESIAFGEPRRHPDLQWRYSEIDVIELHPPPSSSSFRWRHARRHRMPWRVRLRNTRGERFPPVFRLASETDARGLAEEIAEQTGATIELVRCQ